jgi:hypothetical protein
MYENENEFGLENEICFGTSSESEIGFATAFEYV